MSTSLGAFHPGGPPDAYVPRAYHQLLRGPGYRWWRPVASLVLMLLGAFVVYVIWALTTLALMHTLPEVRHAARDGGAHSDAFNLLTTNLLLASAVPLTMVVTWAAHGWRPRWMLSVAGRLRWGWLAACGVVALLVQLVGTVAAYALSGGAPEGRAHDVTLLLSIVVITTPLQAAGEEFLFRGWIVQNVGALIRHPTASLVVGGVVSSALFALAHGQQNGWLILDRFAFGVVAFLLVWRTGGLEASIALHVVNNVVVFVPVILAGQVHDALTVTTASGSMVLLDILILAVLAGVVLLVFERTRQHRLFVPPARWGE